MTEYAIVFLISLFSHTSGGVINPEFIKTVQEYPAFIRQDPSGKNHLLNGRIWRNEYSKTAGDQFFLSNSFLKGSITYDGQRYNNLDLLYDILNDELILKIESYPIIIMNKEMVDSFTLLFENRKYDIFNSGNDTASILRGYVNILYKGASELYVKYKKKINPLAQDGIYDLFQEEHRIYLSSGAEILPVAGKRKFLSMLKDKKEEINQYIKSNKLKLVQKDPYTFVPVLKYYDSIKSGER